MDDLVEAVKSKKELNNLDDDYVRDRVEAFMLDHPEVMLKYDNARDFSQFSRSAEYKDMLKSVRKDLRTVYGVFQESDREGLLAAGDWRGILESHTSTRERIPYYEKIYSMLSDLMPAPKKMLDLGCGMNPLSYPLMAEHGWRPFIIASDISSADMDFLQKCFQVFSIPGTTFPMDLVKEYEKLEESDADVTLMLKLVDSLEEEERHITYRIMEKIPPGWVVVSFPTKSLGGRKRISTRGRSWFEKLLNRSGWEFSTFQVDNELFYVVRK